MDSKFQYAGTANLINDGLKRDIARIALGRGTRTLTPLRWSKAGVRDVGRYMGTLK